MQGQAVGEGHSKCLHVNAACRTAVPHDHYSRVWADLVVMHACLGLTGNCLNFRCVKG